MEKEIQKIESISMDNFIDTIGVGREIMTLKIELDGGDSFIVDYEKSKDFKIGDKILIKIDNYGKE